MHCVVNSSNDIILKAKALGKSFPSPDGEIPVLKGVDFALRRGESVSCLLYTSDAADDTPCVDLGGHGKSCLLYTSPSPRD